MSTEQLAALKSIAAKAAEMIRHPGDCDCTAQFHRRFDPTTCLENYVSAAGTVGCRIKGARRWFSRRLADKVESERIEELITLSHFAQQGK